MDGEGGGKIGGEVEGRGRICERELGAATNRDWRAPELWIGKHRDELSSVNNDN